MAALVLQIQVDDQGSPVIKSFTQSVQGAGGQVRTFGGHADTTRAQVDRLGTSFGSVTRLALGVTAGLVGFQGASAAINFVTNSITSFDKELANVNTLLIGSNVSIKDLEQQILALPPALGSASELTRGLYEALSAGIPPGQAVQFVGESAKIASAGLTDLKSTVKLVTNVMDQFGLSANETARIGDILFTVVNRGKTEFAPLAGAIGDVFPLAKNLGISFEETAATFATLTKVFPTAGQAATGFTGILQGLIQNTEAFRAAGINVRAVIAEEGLTGVLRRLGEVTGESSEVIKARFITEIQGTNAALSIMGQLLNEQRQNITAIGEAAETSGKAFNRQQESITKTLERIGNAFERIVLGGGLTPLILSMLQPIEQWVISLNQGGQASLQFATVTTSAIGSIVGGLDFFVQGTALVVEGWQRIGEVVGIVADLGLRAVEFFVGGIKSLGFTVDTSVVPALMAARDAVLTFSESQGAAADKTKAFRETFTAGFAAIQASVARAGSEATTFASTLGGVGTSGTKAGMQVAAGLQQAAAATQGAATAVQQANTAVEISTAQTVTGTVTFWRDGQLQIRKVLERTAQTGSTSAKDIGEAFSKAGVSTRDALQQIATDALARFSVILNSGRATPQDILEEWRKTAKLINEAGFQTLPPGAQEAFTRVTALAKKAGVDLGTIFTDTFGQIRLGSKQLGETVGNEFSIVFGEVLAAEIALGGARGVASLDEATRKMALQLGLVSQTAIETGAALKQGIGEGAKEGVEQALPALQKLDTGLEKTNKNVRTIRDNSISFFFAFPTTIIGLRKAVDETNRSINDLSRTTQQFGAGAFQFFLFQAEERLEALQKRLKEAEVADFDLNKRFDETVGSLGKVTERTETFAQVTQEATQAQNQFAEGLSVVRDTLRQATRPVDIVKDAFAALGATTSQALETAAAKALESFTIIRNSGELTGQALITLWEKTVLPRIEAALAASNLTADNGLTELQQTIQETSAAIAAYVNDATDETIRDVQRLLATTAENFQDVERQARLTFETIATLASGLVGVNVPVSGTGLIGMNAPLPPGVGDPSASGLVPASPRLPPAPPAIAPGITTFPVGTTRTVQVTNNITIAAAQLTRQSGQDLLDQLLPALRQTIQRGLLAF